MHRCADAAAAIRRRRMHPQQVDRMLSMTSAADVPEKSTVQSESSARSAPDVSAAARKKSTPRQQPPARPPAGRSPSEIDVAAPPMGEHPRNRSTDQLLAEDCDGAAGASDNISSGVRYAAANAEPARANPTAAHETSRTKSSSTPRRSHIDIHCCGGPGQILSFRAPLSGDTRLGSVNLQRTPARKAGTQPG